LRRRFWRLQAFFSSLLSAGEPDAALFAVPATFQEVPPSGLYVPVCLNGKSSSVPDAVTERLDQNYYNIRSLAPAGPQ
jgi:hypothetical protein